MTCYFPNGQVAALDVPCSITATQSTCCGAEWACLSDNMCFALPRRNITSGDPVYSRGSCTDATWQSDSRFQYCRRQDTDNLGGGLGLGKCDNPATNAFFCVNGVGSDVILEGISLHFLVPAPTIVKDPFPLSTTASSAATIATSSSTISSTTPAAAEDSSTKPSSSTSAVSSSGQSSNTSPTTFNSAASTARTSTTSGLPIASASSLIPAPPPPPSRSVAVGAGVGASLGIIALAAIGGLFWLYQRRAKRPRQSRESGPKYEQAPQNVLEQPVDAYHDVQATYRSMSPMKDAQQQHRSYELPSDREVYELSQVNAGK